MRNWRQDAGGEGDVRLADLWMVPYADLMTTMVILFLGFYGYSQLFQKKRVEFEKTVAEIQKELAVDREDHKKIQIREKESDAAEKIMAALAQKKETKVMLTAQRIRVTFASPMLFNSGSAELKKGAETVLDPIVKALEEIPNAVNVEGHTDNDPVSGRGLYKSNFELSALRASRVIEYFIGRGLDPGRFSAYGYGEHQPLADNATEDGRAKNRRIELFVVRQ
ncbi:MAG: OmpA family protein [Elusimicrobia bacterium]|nr:OmpA family protein [Elusimicrobiota bacterium]